MAVLPLHRGTCIEHAELLDNSESSFDEEFQTEPDDIHCRVGSQKQVNTSLESVANPNESSSFLDSSKCTFKKRRE